ncbi:MAG: hypothetical protein CMO81_04200 [Waddliaceae bacterium]|nr:hypothetical protein [Waddliaceae bacterium]
MLEALKIKVKHVGKPGWRDLLIYLATLHERGIHAPTRELPYLWEEVMPGGTGNAMCGHWDTVHMALDTLSAEPQHALYQVLNQLSLQTEEGLIPGHVWMQDGELCWNSKISCPPLWPVVVQDYIEQTGNIGAIPKVWKALTKQIGWFEKYRKADEQGFYYLDILDRFWESGVEEGARYDISDEFPDDLGCVDASAHMFLLYDFAARWAAVIGEPASPWEAKRTILRHWIQNELFDEEQGIFLDQWQVGKQTSTATIPFEGLWPVIVGAASSAQAQRVINEQLLNPMRFCSEHPVTSLSLDSTEFTCHYWRGPTRNSQTYWAARACLRYGRLDAAALLLEKALDMTAFHYADSGTIWEFYHPRGDRPMKCTRPLHGQSGELGSPYKDHLGHNPLVAMAEMWSAIQSQV